jgi:phosphatidylethanolamine-binding protein (PEBP) family uncharacterized protein
MAVLGRLLRNRRAGEARSAWNMPNLLGPELLRLTSTQFADEGAIPLQHAGRLIGGQDVSPQLAWNEPPSGTAQLMLLVEDLDVPMSTPLVHALALIDPSSTTLAAGALSPRQPPAGVTVLRSSVGRGYRGPGPIKGHGPHRYAFELFALGAAVDRVNGSFPKRAKPRTVLSSVSGPVLARGRLTGTYER